MPAPHPLTLPLPHASLSLRPPLHPSSSPPPQKKCYSVSQKFPIVDENRQQNLTFLSRFLPGVRRREYLSLRRTPESLRDRISLDHWDVRNKALRVESVSN